MKFWELTSIFRSERNLLQKTLKQDKWKRYYDNYLSLEHIVKKQDRQILDEEIPLELAMEVCSHSKIKFWFYKSRKPPLLSSYEFDSKDPVDVLSASQALVRFNGHFMEEALEKSYTEV